MNLPLDDISTKRVEGGWILSLAANGAAMSAPEPFHDLDGLLIQVQGAWATMAGLAGATTQPARPRGAVFDAHTFTDFIIVKSKIKTRAETWIMRAEFADSKLGFTGSFSTFGGLMAALRDLMLFAATRTGKMSVQAGNRYSTLPMAPGVVGKH